MGKNNKGKKSEGSETSAPRRRGNTVRRTFVERLIFKGDTIHSNASEIARLCESRGAPSAVTNVAKSFVSACEQYREHFFGLRSAGPDGAEWTPSGKGKGAVKIAEGDGVSIRTEFRAKYSYIPGVEDGMAVFVADKVMPRGNGPKAGVEVLLKDQEGKPYGYVPGNQLERL